MTGDLSLQNSLTSFCFLPRFDLIMPSTIVWGNQSMSFHPGHTTSIQVEMEKCIFYEYPEK